MTRRARGPAERAAARTITALIAAGALDRARDATAIERLHHLTRLLDEGTSRVIPCPNCEHPFDAGANTTEVARLSREVRAWWEAIRARKDAVTQGVNLADLFADLDAQLRADAQ